MGAAVKLSHDFVALEVDSRRDRVHGMEVVCPYCGETISIYIDAGGGASQRYVEDCSVCCRPIELSVEETEDGTLDVAMAARADE